MLESNQSENKELFEKISNEFADLTPKESGLLIESEVSKIRKVRDKSITIEGTCAYYSYGIGEETASGSGKIVGGGLFPDLYFEFVGPDSRIYDDSVTFDGAYMELRKGVDWLKFLKPLLDAFNVSIIEWGLDGSSTLICYADPDGRHVRTSVSGIHTLLDLLEALGFKVEYDIGCVFEDAGEYDDHLDDE